MAKANTKRSNGVRRAAPTLATPQREAVSKRPGAAIIQLDRIAAAVDVSAHELWGHGGNDKCAVVLNMASDTATRLRSELDNLSSEVSRG